MTFVENVSRWEPRTIHPALRWGLALAAFGAAFAIRYQLEGELPPGFPYVTFFPAVIIGSYFLGTQQGVAIAVASGLSAWYYFIPPLQSFSVNSASIIAMLFYAFIAGISISLIYLGRRTMRALDLERKANARLAEQRHLMFQELQHRVSNNLATVSGLLKLQRRMVTDDAAGVALEDSVRRIDLVARIMRNLHDPSGQTVDMARFLADTGRDLVESSGAATRVGLTVDALPLSVGPDVSMPLGLIAAELVVNTLEHAFPGGRTGKIIVHLAAGQDAGRALLRIVDNGQGLPDNFDIEKTRSLGLSIARQFAKQLGGTLAMERRPEGGTEARLEFCY